MSREFKSTSGFEDMLLMDPATFGHSRPVSNQIKETETGVDILLMSFDMSEEYIKEFYRLLGVNSSFYALPFSTINREPVKFIFKKRSSDNKYVELISDDGKEYIFLENSLKPNSRIQVIDKQSKKPKEFLYTLGKNK